MDEGCTQPLSSDPMIHLNTTIFFLIEDVPFVRNLHKLEPLTLTILITMKTTRVREGIETHAKSRIAATTHTSQETSTQTQRSEFTTQQVLKSQSQWSRCVLAESRHLRMFNKGLVFCSMRLGAPFIAPRQLGAVGSPFGRQFLPSIYWRTGHE
jgi:hypothetical protein